MTKINFDKSENTQKIIKALKNMYVNEQKFNSFVSQRCDACDIRNYEGDSFNNQKYEKVNLLSRPDNVKRILDYTETRRCDMLLC